MADRPADHENTPARAYRAGQPLTGGRYIASASGPCADTVREPPPTAAPVPAYTVAPLPPRQAG